MAQSGGSDDGHNPHKITKMGNKGKNPSSSIPKSSASQVHKEAISNVDMLGKDSPANPTEVSIKKTADIQVAAGPSEIQHGDAISQNKDQKKPTVNPSEKHKSKLKESGLQNTSTQRSNDNISHASKSHSGKQLDKADGLDMSIQRKELDGLVERLDLNATPSRASLSAAVSNFLLHSCTIFPKVALSFYNSLKKVPMDATLFTCIILESFI